MSDDDFRPREELGELLRSKSGLGTMSTQNANAVAITGGTVTGLTNLTLVLSSTGTLSETITNGNGGVAADSRYILNNGTSVATFALNGTGYTTSGIFRQDGAYVYCNGAGGLTIDAAHASGIVYIACNNSEIVQITTSRVSFAKPIKRQGYTVATLPAGTEGDTAYVTDATAPTYLGALTGGGAVKAPCFYNGSAWVSG